MKTQNKQLWMILAAITVLLSGCGQAAYDQGLAVSEQKNLKASYVIPAKVDILLALDDSGSMYNAQQAVKSQVPSMISRLDKSGWDYHFAAIPLTNARNFAQVVASPFDPNWGDQWQQPYPGALISNFTGVVGSAFRTFFQSPVYTELNGITPNNISGSWEEGFKNIYSALNYERITHATGFLRSDAMLVILMVGNGNDESDVPICSYPGSTTPPGPCNGGVDPVSFNDYLNRFIGFKSGAAAQSQVRFFSAVAQETSCNTYGTAFRAKIGLRYMQMTDALGGGAHNVDFCSSDPVSTLLSHISSSLTTVRLSMETFRAVLNVPAGSQPKDDEHFKVYKNGTLLARSATNGWTYIGMQTNVPTVRMNTPQGAVENSNASGFMIELHGSAVLVGNDTVNEEFQLIPSP